MIEVDGLMAAVTPMSTASSPSADAPAEFAAAMALVEGESGQRGAEQGVGQGVEQLLAAELADTAPIVGVESESLDDAESADGSEVALASLASVTPTATPGLVPSASVSPTGDVAEGSVPTAAPSVTAPAEAEPALMAAITGEPTIATEEAAVDVPVDGTGSMPADASIPADGSAVVADGDTAPGVATTVAPEVAHEAETPAPVVAPTRSIDDLVTDEPDGLVPDEPDGLVPDEPRAVVDPAVPDAQTGAVPATAAGTANPVTPAVADPVGIAAAEPTLEGVEGTTAASTSGSPDAVPADDAIAAPSPHSAPPAETTEPTVQSAVASTPTPRADTAVADVADVSRGHSTPPSESTPTQQVAEALREVRRLADGSHRLSLQLHPEELGAVQLEVAIRDGRLHVRAVAETEAARAALEQNLPELRSDLRDAGVRAGSLEVGPDAFGRDRSHSPDRDARPQTRRGAVAEESPTPTREASTSSGLDIRL